MLKRAAIFVISAALTALPHMANAAECFDRDTDDPKAGNATAVTGPEVGLLHSNASDYVRPDSGDDIFTGDRVRTGVESHLQLKLCDWSTYTFSPESEADIAEFFDLDGAQRRRAINYIRGGFRYGSGRDTEPGSTEVEVQESGVTMGVRGTNVLLVELDGVVYVLLEGPAFDNSGLTPKGLVEFWEGSRDAIVARLKRPGYVLTIGPDGVSRPFRADAALLRRIYEAFVPVIPDEDADPTDYAGNPGAGSGQGAQEGALYQELAGRDAEQDDENTENYPEEPFRNGPAVGEVLPLGALEEYAAAQGAMPDGHVFALAPAQLFVDSGAGPALADEGVALLQIHIDWASRTVAPEALASFVKLDFSVSNPADLSVRNLDFEVPQEVESAYLQAILASAGLPFTSGQNGLAVIPSQVFTFIVRQGPGDTVTADVEVDFSANDLQATSYNAMASFFNLAILPGPGELAAFEFPLGRVLTPTEFEGSFGSTGTSVLRGDGNFVVSTLGAPSIVDGVSFGQLEVNFNNRTVGGGSSFLAITSGGATGFAPLNLSTSFDNGLFGLGFYPLSLLSSDPDVLRGQALIANLDDLGADIAAILDAGGVHLFTEVEAINSTGRYGAPLASIAGLDANTLSDFVMMGVSAGAVGNTLHYDGSTGGRGFDGTAQIETAGNVFAFGQAQVSIDINFPNRTIGGGDSYVSVVINDTFADVNVNFVEFLNTINFADAVSGAGVFGLDATDFDGDNIRSALFLIRNDPQFTGQGEFSELFFTFTDGAGGKGAGNSDLMPLLDGATPGR